MKFCFMLLGVTWSEALVSPGFNIWLIQLDFKFILVLLIVPHVENTFIKFCKPFGDPRCCLEGFVWRGIAWHTWECLYGMICSKRWSIQQKISLKTGELWHWCLSSKHIWWYEINFSPFDCTRCFYKPLMERCIAHKGQEQIMSMNVMWAMAHQANHGLFHPFCLQERLPVPSKVPLKIMVCLFPHYWGNPILENWSRKTYSTILFIVPEIDNCELAVDSLGI